MNLEKQNDFMLLEREKFPWASTQSMADIIQEVTGQLLELTEELIKQPKNNDDVAEELVDVFSDVMLLFHVEERDNEILSMEDIIKKALDKKLRLKGWILEGKHLNREEASNYWYSAKELEKIQKEHS